MFSLSLKWDVLRDDEDVLLLGVGAKEEFTSEQVFESCFDRVASDNYEKRESFLNIFFWSDEKLKD